MFKINNRIQTLGLLFALINCVTGALNPQEGLGDQEPDRPCIPRNFGKGSIVCVCNSTYCDSTKIQIPSQFPPFSSADEQYNRGLIHIYTSTKTGSRLHKSTAHFNRIRGADVGHFPQDSDGQTLDDRYRSTRQLPNRNPRFFMEFFDKPLDFTDSVTSSSIPSANELNLFNYVGDFPRPNRVNEFEIKRDVQYQKVIGIGGAFTDAAGLNIASLSRDTQENLIRSYFGQDGNDYSMGRVPIGGTDFSTRPYTYDDDVESLGGSDRNLTRFALQPEDHKLKIPYIQWAQSLSQGKLKLVASPWSAPGWMKSSNRIKGGILKKEYYQLWADYFVKFLQEYKKLGIDIWGVTTGNEPVNGFIPNWPFNCMGWSAKNMRQWIANNLGPTLASLRPEIDPRIIILDDNKGAVPTWAKEILGDGSASQYVDGVGTHWYMDFWTGSDALSRFHTNYPDYFIVQTEACLGFTPWELEKVIIGSWERAEQYLEAIIRDMKNWVGGWIDWNLALDLKGGPNWAKLAADAAILVDAPNDEFFKQPIYYAIGHVSKFVPADSIRIQMNSITDNPPRNLQSVAFLRPDNGTVIVFLNKLNYDAKVSLFDEQRGSVFLSIPAKSIQTLLYCCRVFIKVDIKDNCNSSNFQQLHFGQVSTVKCTSCDKCIGLFIKEEFKSLDRILQDSSQSRNGWKTVEGESDHIVFFTLSQIIYKEYEVPEESQLQTDYAYPPLTDVAKLLWINGTAAGFYTVKHKGTLDEDYMEWYTMTVLDTIFIRVSHRRQGHASTAVKDLLAEFPDEDIGFSFPISIPMQKVLEKHLELHPHNRRRFWEITGCGSEGNCRNLWLTLRRCKTQATQS